MKQMMSPLWMLKMERLWWQGIRVGMLDMEVATTIPLPGRPIQNGWLSTRDWTMPTMPFICMIWTKLNRYG